jgi:hypothetical protein
MYKMDQRKNGTEKKIPVVAKFFASVQTGPRAHPSLLYNGYQLSFPGINQPGRGVDHPLPSSAEVKEK